MAIRKLIKNFTFEEPIRSDLVFSDTDKIRLNTEDLVNQKLQLKVASGQFPVASTGPAVNQDIHVRTPLFNPAGVQKWLKFEARVTEDASNNFNTPVGTDVRFRVLTSDFATIPTFVEYWWDGGAWAVATSTDWNTETEISANIPTFPMVTVGNKGIGFVVNLRTIDPAITPEVKELKLLGQFEIEVLDSLVYDGVIRTLNKDFRSSSVLRRPGTGSSIDLNSVLDNKGYNVTDIRSVYDLVNDPLKLTNLFDSYALGSLRKDGFTHDPGIITLNSVLPSGAVYEVTFEYVPEVYVRQGQDFFEVPTFPSIIFENIQILDRPGFTLKNTNSVIDFIRDKDAGNAVVQRSPRQNTIRFEWAVFTNSQLDQMRLVNDINQFWANNKFIREFNLDCLYGIEIFVELSTSRNQKASDDTDTNVATGSFDVLGVLFFDKPALDEPLVDEGKLNVAVQST